jgi:hypothetical protein
VIASASEGSLSQVWLVNWTVEGQQQVETTMVLSRRAQRVRIAFPLYNTWHETSNIYKGWKRYLLTLLCLPTIRNDASVHSSPDRVCGRVGFTTVSVNKLSLQIVERKTKQLPCTKCRARAAHAKRLSDWLAKASLAKRLSDWRQIGTRQK